MLIDLRYALTSLRQSPGLAITVLLTFALGIGVTTAVFSVVHGVLLRPLPYSAADRLVRIWEEHPGGSSLAGQRWLSNHTHAALSAGAATLDGVGAFATYDRTVAFVEGEPLKAFGSPVSPSVFRMLGATPALGRFFDEREAREGAARVVVIGDRLWRERFGASADVLGRTFWIEGDLHTIVGVARPSLEFPDPRVLFWTPNVIQEVARDPARTSVFSAIARLRPGATVTQAEAEATAAARTMPRPMSADLMFGKGGPVVVHVRPLAADITAPVRPALLVVTAAVLLLLLIACANIANMLLSRGIARERELVIRVAVGASRGRLVRQLLTESAALSVAGGLLGLLLAALLVRALPAIAPPRLPRLEEVRLDWVVMTFSVAASLLTGLAAGLAPALRASRFELYQSIRDTAASAGRGAGGRRLRYALLVAESAFAILLVVGAGLLARSFAQLVKVDGGYTADHVLTARIQMPRDATPEQTTHVIERVLGRLRSMPGVVSAGAGSMMPMTRMTAISSVTLPETVTGGKPSTARAVTYTVTPGYAEALSMRLKAGRLFVESDDKPGPRPILVNEEFVRQYVTGPAVGRRLGSLYQSDKGLETEIVGVVGNVLKDGNDRTPEPEIYFVHAAGNRRIVGWVNFVVKTTGNPAALGDEVRSLLRDTDRLAVVERIDPLTTLVSASVEQPRFGVTVVSAFAGLAIVLAAVGLYGVLSYGVSQRRRELGVRAALGADRRRLLGLVLREALAVTAIGATAGLAAAAVLTRLIQSLLFGISALDPVTYATAPVVLLVVALIAALVPAARAARTDPALVLKN